MADIGIAGSDTGINGLPQTPHCKYCHPNSTLLCTLVSIPRMIFSATVFDWNDTVIKREVISFDFSFKSISSHKVTHELTF